MNTLFLKLVGHIIEREGGYVDHPDDSGGATCWGITEALARQHGYAGRMRELTQDEARRIYHDEFWAPLQLDGIYSLSPQAAEELFDTAVNTGKAMAAGWLQRTLNAFNLKATIYADLKVDGQIGPATLNALRTYLTFRKKDGERVLLRALNSLQGAFYISLAEKREKDESFVFGWLLNRVQ